MPVPAFILHDPKMCKAVGSPSQNRARPFRAARLMGVNLPRRARGEKFAVKLNRARRGRATGVQPRSNVAARSRSESSAGSSSPGFAGS